MRSALYFLPCALLTAAIAFSCGGTNGSSDFRDGGSNGGGDATTDDGGPGLGDDGPTFGSDTGGPKPQCQGLECQWVDCASMGKPETVLSGTVYDPAGNLPLYNVYVYVPNTTPLPIGAGNPTCTACEAPASGSPIIGALTDPQGHFSIQYKAGGQYNFGVPAGQDIPLVIQVGKWRKQLKIPSVTACQTNDLDGVFNSGSGKARQMRLPGNGSEGDMPLIAFTSGCDPAECFLRHVGIDDSEFAPPGTAGKHVHFYTGWDGPTGSSPASAVSGGNTPQQTYQWWSNASNLLKYDIVFDACECVPNDRGASAYAAMQQYLDNGGRLFTTHFYYNWFTQPGVAEYANVAAWAANSANGYSTYWIDTSFPKGQAYGAWLLANGIATGSMQAGISIAVTDTRNDVNQAGLPTYPDSTRWIYNADSAGSMGAPPSAYSTEYVSFNTPVTPKPAPDGGAGLQCGRAVFSDVHLSGNSDNSTFPNECANADPGGQHTVNEKALEFLFFDLSSCIQNDTQPPPPPPPQ